MKSIIANLIIVISLLICSGCSWNNMFKGSDDYYQNFYAEELTESIDTAIKCEITKSQGPTGHAQRPYSRELWNESWNRRIYSILNGSLPDAYRGPTQIEYVKYIINSRREASLPELELSQKTRKLIGWTLPGTTPAD